MLTALSKAEGLRCAASFVIAAYFSVRLIPQDLRALHLCRLIPTFYEIIIIDRVIIIESRIARLSNPKRTALSHIGCFIFLA
jgi:hypothetical protein